MYMRRFEVISFFVVLLLLNIFASTWLLSGNAYGVALASRFNQSVDAAAIADTAAINDAAAVAAIPTAFSYQGSLRLADGSLATGSYNVTLKLYNTVTGGTALHSETYTNTVVRNGNFSVIVGDAKAIAAGVFDNANLYIGITVAPDPEMLPRQRLLPVPWAMQAAVAKDAVNATNATNAQTANTLVANATIPGQLTIDRGVAGVSNNKWPALLLASNGDGYGSALYLRNISGNQNWSIHPDPSGEMRFEDRNNGVIHLAINQNGTARFGGSLNVANIFHAETYITTSGYVSAGTNVVAQGKVYATQGFNGKCVEGAFNQGVVGNNLNVTCNQDVAETFASEQRTEPGDLVVFVPSEHTFSAVRRSAKPYESMIVGVVSTNPGLVFDQGQTYLAGDNANLITDKKTVVAMVGRVPTKFSLENGPINIGDPLTSSSKPGVAMKATEAGQIIGYAMQSSKNAKDGKLLVWLQLGTYVPPVTLDALNEMMEVHTPKAIAKVRDSSAELSIADLQAQIAELSAQVAKLRTNCELQIANCE